MSEWVVDLIIFAIVIIANIIGGIVKIKQKKKAVKKLDLPPAEPPEYSEDYGDEEYFEEQEDYIPENSVPESSFSEPSEIQNIPFPATTAANAPCPECPPEKDDNFCPIQPIQVEDIDDDSDESMDYGEFMRTRGRDAFVLAEIILPANSRQKY